MAFRKRTGLSGGFLGVMLADVWAFVMWDLGLNPSPRTNYLNLNLGV